MGVSVLYLKYNAKHNTARMRYRDNGVTDSVKWLFDEPASYKDFGKGEFGQNIAILLADNFLDDVSSMSKQAREELTAIQSIIENLVTRQEMFTQPKSGFVVPKGFSWTDETFEEIVKAEGNGDVFTYRGIRCAVRREMLGGVNGYVDIKGTDHANWFKSDVIDRVHGGWTYDRADILGFDSGHVGDLKPIVFNNGMPQDPLAFYRSVETVTDTVKQIVDAYLQEV